MCFQEQTGRIASRAGSFRETTFLKSQQRAGRELRIKATKLARISQKAITKSSSFSTKALGEKKKQEKTEYTAKKKISEQTTLPFL